MALAHGIDLRLHIAGRDLLAGYGVTALNVATDNQIYDATGLRAPNRRYAYSRFLNGGTLSYEAWHEAEDEPWLVAQGLTSRTLEGGMTFRVFPSQDAAGNARRGLPSLVSPQVRLQQHGLLFNAPGEASAAKVSGSGYLSGDTRDALTLEDRLIVGRTGTGGEADREIDLRGAPIRWGEPATRASGNRILNLAVLNSDIRSGKIQQGDRIDIDGLTPAAGVTDYFQVTRVQVGNVNEYGTMSVASAADSNAVIWTGAQYTAFQALGRGGTFRVLRHAASTAAGSTRSPHALVVHVQTVTWRDADRLRVRPVFRSTGATSALGGWQRTAPWVTFNKSAGVTDDDNPYAERFYSWQAFTSEQPTEVALDWEFFLQSGQARTRSDYAFRVVADYVPVVGIG